MASNEPVSRYRYARVFTDDVPGSVTFDRSYLGFREPVSYRDDPDNVTHIVQAGDNLQTLAHRYFAGMPEAANMWSVLAEFQPTPILDPTKRLEPGSILMIPSPALINALTAGEPKPSTVKL
jgi:nucleoid-associated protein YgaU